MAFSEKCANSLYSKPFPQSIHKVLVQNYENPQNFLHYPLKATHVLWEPGKNQEAQQYALIKNYAYFSTNFNGSFNMFVIVYNISTNHVSFLQNKKRKN